MKKFPSQRIVSGKFVFTDCNHHSLSATSCLTFSHLTKSLLLESKSHRSNSWSSVYKNSSMKSKDVIKVFALPLNSCQSTKLLIPLSFHDNLSVQIVTAHPRQGSTSISLVVVAWQSPPGNVQKNRLKRPSAEKGGGWSRIKMTNEKCVFWVVVTRWKIVWLTCICWESI